MKRYERKTILVAAGAVLSAGAAALVLSHGVGGSAETGVSAPTVRTTNTEPIITPKTSIPNDAPHRIEPSAHSYTQISTTTKTTIQKPHEPCDSFPGFEGVYTGKDNLDERRNVKLKRGTVCTVGLTALSGGNDLVMESDDMLSIVCVNDGSNKKESGVTLATSLAGPAEYSLPLTPAQAASVMAIPNGSLSMPLCP